MREAGRESHKNDIVESKENRGKGYNSTSTTRLHRHHLRHLERKHQQKERKRTETKTGMAIVFDVPRSNNHWLSTEASAPVVFVRLSASFQEKESRTEKKGKRREENREKKGERGKQHMRTPDERRQQRTEKKGHRQQTR